MVALTWGPGVSPRYERGVDKGVIYIGSAPGVSWTGLIGVQSSADGVDIDSFYLDGIKYRDQVSPKEYSAEVSAFSYPRELMPCFGHVLIGVGFILTKQPRIRFGFSYRSSLGPSAYKIHLVYNATITPKRRGYSSLSDRANPTELAWDLVATPPTATTYKPTAHLVVDSTRTNATKLATLENLLYGTSVANSQLPTQATVITTLT